VCCVAHLTGEGNGFVLVYSLTSKNSFLEVQMVHEKILRTKGVEWAPVVLVGNKSDLKEKRVISHAEGQDLANIYRCPFYETSAKAKINIEATFGAVVKEIRKWKNLLKPRKATRRRMSSCVIL